MRKEREKRGKVQISQDFCDLKPHDVFSLEFCGAISPASAEEFSGVSKRTMNGA